MPYPHRMDVAGDDGTKLPKNRDTYSLELSVVSQPAVWPILCFAFIHDRCSVLLLSARLPRVGWGIAGNCSGLQDLSCIAFFVLSATAGLARADLGCPYRRCYS